MLTKGKWLAIPLQQEASDGSALNVAFAPSEKKGTLGGTVKFEWTSGPAKGETAYWTGWFSDGALKNTMKAFRAIGFQGDDIDAWNDQDPLSLREVELTVDEEEYNGKLRPKIQWVNKPRRTMAREDVRAAAADLKERLAKFVEPDDTIGPDPDDQIAF